MFGVKVFGVKGECGVATLSFSKPAVEDKNVFVFPAGLSDIIAGRSGGRLTLGSVTIHAVAFDENSGALVESRVMMRGEDTSVSARPNLVHSYNLASPFNPCASRVLLILNCMGLRWGEDVTFKLKDSDGEVLFDHTFDVRDAGERQALVLGVLDRTADGWLAGPVGAMASRYSSLWAARLLPSLSEPWKIGLPNPLSNGWRQTRLVPDAFAHLVAHVPDNQLPTAYQQGLFDLGQNFTVDYATDLLARLVYQWSDKSLSTNQTAVANDLINRGAGWRDVFFNVELSDEQCISALIRVGQMQPSWAALLLNTYPLSQIVGYTTTAEKADAVYQLVPHECLLDRMSEHRRVGVLEQDLGL